MTDQPLYACAGCNNAYPESNLLKRGLVRSRLYCETCVVEIDILLHIRDAVHTEAARNLEEDLLHEVKTFQKQFPKFGLPDA